MEDAKKNYEQVHSSVVQKLQKLISNVKLEFNIDFIHRGASCCMLNDTFIIGNFETILNVNLTKAILDGIEFWASKIIYKDICIKVHGLWGWGFVCPSVSRSILRSAIVANAFYSDLKTRKSQIFPMIAPRRGAKLSTSPKVTIFTPPVTYYFISDQCLKGDR